MLNNIKGAIFDMDGTLVDSMWVWTQIDIDYLKLKGHAIPADLREHIAHLSFSQTAEYFKKRFHLDDSIDNILDSWSNMAAEYYRNGINLKPGVIEFLNKLKSQNVKIALATSNSIPLLEICLKNNNIYDYFDAITITDEVKVSKDNPDIYLLAAKKINVAPENCIVFEDILPAVKGAKSANMKVVAVHDSESMDPKETLSKYADIYIESFYELL